MSTTRCPHHTLMHICGGTNIANVYDTTVHNPERDTNTVGIQREQLSNHICMVMYKVSGQTVQYK